MRRINVTLDDATLERLARIGRSYGLDRSSTIRFLAGKEDRSMRVVASLSYSGGNSVPLTLNTEHPASHYGTGVLVLGPNPDGDTPGEPGEGDVLDVAYFRRIRDQFGDGTGAEIICKPGQRLRVCAALGVPEDEPGITEE